MKESDLTSAAFKKFTNNLVLTDEEKVKLGELIPFVHNHGPRVGRNTWYVTHNLATIKKISLGAPKVFDAMPWLKQYNMPTGKDTVAFGFQPEHGSFKSSTNFQINDVATVRVVLLCLSYVSGQRCRRLTTLYGSM